MMINIVDFDIYGEKIMINPENYRSVIDINRILVLDKDNLPVTQYEDKKGTIKLLANSFYINYKTSYTINKMI